MRLLAILPMLLLLVTQTAAQTAGSSLRGTLLVAGPQMAGSFFAETVILVVQNTPDGSLGVTVNRPTDLTVDDVLPDEFGAPARGYTVYAGGPVGLRRLSILVRSDDGRSDLDQILPHVAFTLSAPLFDAVLARGPDAGDVHVIAGVAGWDSGQLEHEIANGDWYIVPANEDLIFSDKPADLWQQLIDRLDGNEPNQKRRPRQSNSLAL